MFISKYRTSARVLLVIYLISLGYLYFGNPSMDKEIPTVIWIIPLDKLAHFLMILPLPLLSFCSFFKKDKWKTLFWTFFISLILVTVLELTQSTVNPERQTELLDLVANIISLVTVSGILALIKVK